MAYTDAEYIDAVEFEDRDVEIRAYEKKIVVTRKEHPCFYGHFVDKESHQIPPGTRAVRESGIMEGEWGSAYHCLDCIGKWLDAEANR